MFKSFIYIIKLIKFLLSLLRKNIQKNKQIKRQVTSFEKCETYTQTSKSQSSLYSNLEKNPNKFTFAAVAVQVTHMTVL